MNAKLNRKNDVHFACIVYAFNTKTSHSRNGEIHCLDYCHNLSISVLHLKLFTEEAVYGNDVIHDKEPRSLKAWYLLMMVN